MNTPSLFRRLLRISLWTLLGSTVFVALGVANLLWLPSEARVLRDEVLKAEAGASTTKIQLNLGACSLGLVRTILSQVEGVDAEARLALSSVKSVAVGVYDVQGDEHAPLSLSALDERMRGRGWVPFLRVRDKNAQVYGYMPREMDSDGIVPVCIAVRESDKLVVVSARADMDCLSELAWKNPALAQWKQTDKRSL